MWSALVVAAGVPDLGTPAADEPHELVEIVAQRLDDRAALAVGRLLDRLPVGAAGRGHPVTLQLAPAAQPLLGSVEVFGRPRPAADVGPHGHAPVQLGEQA